jgi:ribose transport system permease protein
MTSVTLEHDETPAAATPRKQQWGSLLSVRNIAGVYVLALLIVLFGVLEPDKFLTEQTAKTILNQYAVTGIVALALTVPLAAGVFDLSVAATMSFTSMLAAILLKDTDLPILLVIVAAVLAGTLIGLINAVIVVILRIDSFIATLGTGAIITAATVAISDNKTITDARVSGRFADFMAQNNFDGITIPVLYLAVIMLVLGFVLEQTVSGRYMYAIGFDQEAARLSGVRVRLLRGVVLVVSGTVAAFAGVVLTARVTSGTPGAGDPYLLPAFAAAFLGATQFRPGRFNAWGTVLAVMLVGTANYGLLLSSAPQWAPDVFTGAMLLVAVGVTGLERRSVKRGVSADAPGDSADRDKSQIAQPAGAGGPAGAAP